MSTVVKHCLLADLYKDSVSLMVISSKLVALDGITGASVVMATPTNLENLERAGLGRPVAARPTDVVVAVSGNEAACDDALALAATLLAEQPRAATSGGTADEPPPPSIQTALTVDPAAQLALISVPGEYAAAEARKALHLGLHVMIFSDNVPSHHERALKDEATARGLLVMGPDCGTAIVNGFPLGFANVVRRGPIGVVGASGTGTQEITSRIHNLGGGVSHALGTGGHDLHADIGGISMRQGLRMLAADPGTEVLVLASKPPSVAVADDILAAARAVPKPVVVVFLGAEPASFAGGNVVGAATLAEAADLAVALARELHAPRTGEVTPAGTAGTAGTADTGDTADTIPAGIDTALAVAAAALAPGRRFVRGIFCGGTFCYEAQLLLQGAGLAAASNTPVAGNERLADAQVSVGHTVVDMGDDQFTQGRPHPMIDPSLRDERVAREIADPATAVLLFDVVLGHGSTDDPVSALLPLLRDASSVVRVAHVCGTDTDPQDRVAIVAALEAAGVLVASSNAEATRWAARAAHLAGATAGEGVR